MSSGELNIPESWAETRLENALTLINGRAYKQTEFREIGTPIIRIQNLNDGDKWFYSDLKLPPEKYCDTGDLLFAWSASFGPYIWNGAKAIYHYHIWKILNHFSVDKNYSYYYLKHLTQMVKNNAHGLAMLHITKEKMEKMPFLLPPTKEQTRIVEKIESCFSKIEKTEAALNEAEKLLVKYRESLLAKAFRGELVEQDPSDEPASELLTRIRAEQKKNSSGKKKKDELPPISEDEIPFEIPKSWEWVRLEEILSIESGGTPKGLPVNSDGDDIPFIKVADMNSSNNQKHIDEIELYLSAATVENLKIKTFPTGTIIFPKRGGAILTNKKRIVHTPFAADTNIMGLIAPELIREYIWEWFQTINLGNLHTGSSIPQINNGDINPLLIPIPPLREQSRIIQKLEVCKMPIVKQISEIKKYCRHLKESILNNAYQGKLVPQIPEEGTGHELLEQILKAKAAAAGAAKATKEKSAKKPTSKRKK